MTVRAFETLQPKFPSTAFIDQTALVIGDVELGDDASIWPMSVVRGDIESIRIGARTNIQDGSVLHVTHDSEFFPGGHGLMVGDEVTVGHRVVLHGCTVEDRCLIGMGSVVLDGAVIGSESIVAAGALVPPGKVLEGGYLWVGSPVRQARALKPEEIAYFRYSADHYVDLKNRHRR